VVIAAFPPVEQANEYGLIAIGGDLEVPSLLMAYRSGIFPWPMHPEHLTWFAPDPRAVLFFEDLKIPESLKKERRRGWAELKIDQDFEGVIRSCAQGINRGKQRGTWITEQMISAYIDLHKAGHAHSIECYADGNLVGGLYGVCVGRAFAGESMFYRKANASKLCLWFLVEYLSKRGLSWIDCQQLTPLLKSFGAKEISRASYMSLLSKEINKKTKIF
jgi:leucyl/phenylalanyl-tRNA--protein transferase